ncbi:hypothetical protein CHGG_09432 [Chaetomium globosum CBS 148.51]|uniref:Uncharacterized protein n=1 Tax=Chaetomium globosum (strain ATCC 6205 / CBS 148.51 / DSM 1962 / NBRC 6347 / NRRL 1970) TaxID=306901 RepID=Q2GRH2_CHAGB|nr:uncharacterized protein CHGG_09432 [Chaetomium globosum CBS 148.51]EAQ85418.1 hypothetical protein CHGG_09432 [Chaetomium globosum CBS 148.51]
MAAEQRKLLEQLMGGGMASRSAQLPLTDPKVCRSYLVGTCPHDLFTNTKAHLGACPRVHSEALKAEYEGLPEAEKKKYGFEYDYMRDLQSRIESLLEVEILAETGEVARAYDEYYKVRHAQAAKAEREKELKALSETSGPSGHQKLQVCDVCGAYLSRLDNDRRLADHFFGKMHLGFAQMRKAYDAFPKEMRGRQRAPMPMGGGDEEMGGVPTGPGGGYGDGWKGPRGPRSGGFRPRGPRRGW